MAESPTSPDEQPAPGLRASDAERDEVAATLRDEFVAGRLSHDTFVYRMNAVLEARRQADLPPLVADLPAASQPAQPRPAHYQPAQYQAAPAPGARPLVGRLRDAWSRLTGQGGRAGYPGQDGLSGHAWFSGRVGAVPRGHATGPPSVIPATPARAGGGLIRRTMSLRATGDPAPPLPLQFPRGAGGEFSIGRDASCDLAIADMTVSRQHATLERTPDGWLLSDLESTNGTRVNGWRVRGKVTVRPGDLISFGNLEVVFAREDTLPPAGTPAPGLP
jgi:hypothetical protein